jgi:hypothetical protein
VYGPLPPHQECLQHRSFAQVRCRLGGLLARSRSAWCRHYTRTLLPSHYPLALKSGFTHRASFEALRSTPNAQWARCPLQLDAAATPLLQLLIRHLLNATYAAQDFAELHEGLLQRTGTHVLHDSLNRRGARERHIAVISRVEGMPGWHQHSAACVQPAIASCLHLIVDVGARPVR